MMTPPDLLIHLRTLGCALRVDGQTLHVSPSSLLTPALRAAIREHKAALLALLAVDDDPGPWQYHSDVLGEPMWFAWTAADVEALRAEGVVAYTPEEIMLLHTMKAREPEGFAERLRAIHVAKQAWNAEIEGVEVPQEKLLDNVV